MNYRTVLHVIAWLLGVVAALMALCAALSFLGGEPRSETLALLWPALGTLLAAVPLGLATRSDRELGRRDGLAIVAIGWLLVGAVAALPYVLSANIFPGDPVGAFFEAVSGITTTGATALRGIDQAPRSLLLWRALTQFIGGMGVLTLVLAILPFAGGGGMQLFRAEMPGPSKDRLEPRMASTAKRLWAIYVGLAALLALLLRLVGMDSLDAVCHAMAALSTGGFSTRSAGVSAWNSPAIEFLLLVFMLLAAVNFALHYRLLRGDWRSWLSNRESRFFFAVFASASLATALLVFLRAPAGASFLHTLRGTAFTCASLMTTAGFTTVDYGQWPPLAKGILAVLMLMGGCAGSTAGGIKLGRIQVGAAAVLRAVRHFMQPQAVLPVRMDGKPVDETLVDSIVAFLVLFFAVLLVGILAMLPFVPDASTAISSAITAISNTGPGFSAVGPTGDFAAIPAPGKLVLSLLMIAGRLELYTLLVLLLPSFWRK